MTNGPDAADASEDDAAAVPERPEPEALYGAPLTRACGDIVLHPSRETLIETLEAMKADGFVSVLDVCGVDYLEHPNRSVAPGINPERFEVAVLLMSHARATRIRLRVQVPEADPVVPSMFDVFPGTEAPERETWDMFGISFDGHPDMTRILMPDGWEGHPLRKDFAVGAVPVQFKGAPAAR